MKIPRPAVPLGVTLIILTGMVLPAAGAAGARTEKAKYAGFGYIDAGGAEIRNHCARIQGRNTGGACFTPQSDERRVRVRVEDETGMEVAAILVRHGKRDVAFCGSMESAIRIPEGKELAVVVNAVGCRGGGDSPTQGTIIANFSR